MAKQILYEVKLLTQSAVAEGQKFAKALDDLRQRAQMVGSDGAKAFKGINDQMIQQNGLLQSLIDKEEKLRAARRTATNVKDIGAINKELQETVRVRTKLEKMGDSSPSMFRNMVVGAAQAATAFATLETAREVLVSGFKHVADLEQFTKSLEVLTGNAEMAGIIMRDLKKFALESPFELPELQVATRTLLAFGISAGNVMEVLGNISDIAAGSSRSLSDIAYIVGQIQSVGVAFTADLNQLANAGIPIYEELAKQLNTTIFTIRDMASKGQITSDKIQKAFRVMTDEGGRFFGMSEKQSKTLTGKISKLRDEFMSLLEKGFKPLIPFFHQVIDGTISLVSSAKGLVDVFIALPKLYEENKVALGLLVASIMAFNINSTIAIARAIAVNVALRAQAIYARGAAIAYGLLNTAMGMGGAAGAVLQLVGALGAVISYFAIASNVAKRHTDTLVEQKQVMAEITSEYIAQSEEVAKLFDELQRENISRERKLYLLQAINSIYGSVLNFQLTEASTLEQIRAAQEKVNKALYTNILLKQQQTQNEIFEAKRKEIIEKLNTRIARSYEDTSESGKEASKKILKNVTDYQYELEKLKKSTIEYTDLRNKADAHDAKNSKEYLGLVNRQNAAEAEMIKSRKKLKELSDAAALLPDQVTTWERFVSIMTADAFYTGANLKRLENSLYAITEQGIEMQKSFLSLAGENGIDLLNAKMIKFGDQAVTIPDKVGKIKKSHDELRNALKADTSELEENIRKLNQQRHEIEQTDKLMEMQANKTLPKLNSEIVKINREADKLKFAVQEKIKDAEVALFQGLEKQQARLKEDFQEGNITRERYLKELVALNKEYVQESAKIAEVASRNMVELDNTTYAQRMSMLNEFNRDRKHEIEESEKEILALTHQIHRDVLSNDIKGFAARKTAATDQYQETIDRENKINADRYEVIANSNLAVMKLEEELAEAIERGDSDLHMSRITAEINARQNEITAIKKQITNSHLIQKQAKITLNRELKEIDDTYFKEYIQRQEDARKQMLDVMNSAADLTANPELVKSLQNVLTLQKFANTSQGQLLQKEMDSVKEVVDSYEKLSSARTLTDDEIKEYASALDHLAYLEENFAAKQATHKQQAIQTILDTVAVTTKVAMDMLKQLNEAEIAMVERQISVQEKKVEKIRGLLEKEYNDREGANAEQLQLEEERLDKLNQQRREYVNQQKAYAIIELAINSAIAIAKAAAQGGVAAIVTIPLTLAALALGIQAARTQAEAAGSGFQKGGYTGDGNKHEIAGVVHKEEFVFNKEITEKYRPIFEAIHKGKIDLNEAIGGNKSIASKSVFDGMSFGLPNFNPLLTSGWETPQYDIEDLVFELRELRKDLAGHSNTSINITEKGIYTITERARNNIERAKKVAK